MKSELIERLKKLNASFANNLADFEYEALEKWYIALDLDKDTFAKIVTSVGIKTFVDRNEHAETLVTAMDEYISREKYKKDKIKLEEMECEVERLRESTKAFEESQVF